MEAPIVTASGEMPAGSERRAARPTIVPNNFGAPRSGMAHKNTILSG